VTCHHPEGTIPEPDWTPDRDYDINAHEQNPNLLGFMQNEQWVCSDDDLNRAIELIVRVQQARGRSDVSFVAVEIGHAGPFHLGDISGDHTEYEISTWIADKLADRAEILDQQAKKWGDIGFAHIVEGPHDSPDSVSLVSNLWAIHVVKRIGSTT